MSSTSQSLWQQGNLLLDPIYSRFLILVSTFGLVFIIKHLIFGLTTSPKNPPPSPKRLPIIGNLHQLALPLHHSLFSLSKQYGPLLMLHLGRTPVVVISSADAAQEVMKTQDLTFASRYEFEINKKLLYAPKDVVTAPYGVYWRQMKTIFMVKLLSNKRVQTYRVVREKWTTMLMEKIERSSLTELNVSNLLSRIIFDIVCELVFGKSKKLDEETAEKFNKFLGELMKIVGGFDLGEVIPWLAWVSRVSGKDSRVERVAKEMDRILEDVIQERMHQDEDRTAKHFDDEDFVNTLLKIQKEEGSGTLIDRECVKAFLLETFAAGTDTTATLLEWEMSVLLQHPRVMKRLQDEIRGIAKGKPRITEEDLEKSKYLKAVVKETLRLHPPIPMPIPREARQDAKVMGYDVAAKTMVIANLWAIGRDPKAWENPDEFRPERFLDSSIDFKGNDFQFIPFGAGRRGCPGISFATAINEIVLANLVNKFDWELPKGMRMEDLDMTESNDFTIRRKTPLLAVAIPHS